MSDNKKYYYLRFKQDFFQQDHIVAIESMDNGYLYSNIILKLYLKSLKWDGQLRITERVPYSTDPEMIKILSKNLGHNSDNVMHAINLAKTFGIMDILSTGEIFMTDIHDLIGTSSTEADRKAKYRQKIAKKDNPKQVGQCPDKRPPELELETELKKEKDPSPDKSGSPPIVRYLVDFLWQYLKQQKRLPVIASHRSKLAFASNNIVKALIDKDNPVWVLASFGWAVEQDFWKNKVNFSNLETIGNQFVDVKDQNKYIALATNKLKEDGFGEIINKH